MHYHAAVADGKVHMLSLAMVADWQIMGLPYGVRPTNRMLIRFFICISIFLAAFYRCIFWVLKLAELVSITTWLNDCCCTSLLCPSRAAEHCYQFVCLSVCLSVREHISGTAGPIFAKCLPRFPVAVARSSFGGAVIRYVLPILWMTSRLAVMGRMAMRGRLNLERRCDTAVESQYDVYECLVKALNHSVIKYRIAHQRGRRTPPEEAPWLWTAQPTSLTQTATTGYGDVGCV